MFASYLYATGVGSVYFPGVYDMEKGFYSYNEDQLEAVDIFADNGDGAWNVPSFVSLTLEEQTEVAQLENEMTTYSDGEILKFVMGEKPMSEYDDFLKTCQDMGLTRMIEIQQAAYDRAMEALNEE